MSAYLSWLQLLTKKWPQARFRHICHGKRWALIVIYNPKERTG